MSTIAADPVSAVPAGAAARPPEIDRSFPTSHLPSRSSNSTCTQLSYRADIDGLRAVAVLSVLFCHAGIGLSGGYVGVDVFFVISGFLITSLILKDLRQDRFSMREFWVRRIRRIVPALFVVTFATLVAGWFLLLPDAYTSLGKSVVALVLIMANVNFWSEIGYFNPAAEVKPLLHTWSLAVEEQFYLIFPLFLMVIARLKQFHRLFGIVLFASVLSLGLSAYGTRIRPEAAFYLLPTRAFELLIGVLLALRPPDAAPAAPRNLYGEIICLFGLGLIVIPCVIYSYATPFPGLYALPPVLGAAILIHRGAISGRPSLVHRFLAWRVMVFIGLISYSLYLWHWPLIAFARYLLGEIDYRIAFTLVGASFGLGVLSWRYVETPFRSRRVFSSQRGLFAVTSVGFIIVSAGGAYVQYAEGAPQRLSPRARRIAATSQRDAAYIRELRAEDIPANLVQYGAHGVPPHCLVWGDSHAMAILPAIAALCLEEGVAVLGATRSGTPPAVGYYRKSRRAGMLEFNDAVLEYALSAAIPNVLLVGAWDRYLKDPLFEGALRETIGALLKAGIKVYLMKDVPRFGFDIPRRLFYYTLSGEDLARSGLAGVAYKESTLSQSAMFVDLANRGVHILDPIPYLFGEESSGIMLPYDNEGCYYYDSHHLSTYGALRLKSLFVPIIRSSVRPNEAGQ